MATVAMSQEQFKELMENIVRMAAAGQEAAAKEAAKFTAQEARGPREGRHRRILDEKGFLRLKKFASGEDLWGEWSFDLKIALGALYPSLRETLNLVEVAAIGDIEKIKGKWAEFREEEVVQVNAELYETLILGTEGEAKLIVKSVDNGDGVGAYRRLHDRFNR